MKHFQYKERVLSYIIILLVSIFIPSCSHDWLDAKPDKSLVVPETLSDYQGLLDDYGVMNTLFPAGGIIAGEDYFYVTDVIFNLLPYVYENETYKWIKTTRREKLPDWIEAYKKVLADNIILDGLPKVSIITAQDQQDWNNIKGQALFNRAYVFFSLLQTFGAPYTEATANSDLGIPLRTASDITTPTQRNTVKECYNFIIRDVTESLALLPEKAKILSRSSKAAAHAFLSRIYLSMGDYENSLVHATECLEMYNTLLDFGALPIGSSTIGRNNAEVIYHCFSTAVILGPGLIDLGFYNLYHQDDLRKTRFFSYRASTNTVSFVGNYEKIPTYFFLGLATDEVYLNKAECLARLGRTDESIEVLDTLIRTRWNKDVPYIEFEATSPEEALTLILLERKKELLLRGLRWMDLRRLNKDPKFAVSLSRTVNGETFKLEPNSLKYALPIPDDIIEQTGILQNPGWDK